MILTLALAAVDDAQTPDRRCRDNQNLRLRLLGALLHPQAALMHPGDSLRNDRIRLQCMI